jgi:hypothetical protein
MAPHATPSTMQCCIGRSATWQSALMQMTAWSEVHRELVNGVVEPVAGGDVGGDSWCPQRRFCTKACPVAMIRADRWRFSPRIGWSRAFRRP